MTAPASPGRRSAARRTPVNVTTVLAVVLPVLSVLALLLVRPDEPSTAAHPPTATTLTAATLVCPSPLDDDAGLDLTTAADVTGTVTVGLGDQTRDVDVATGRVSTVDAPGATAVTGTDGTAPGLLAARAGGGELATSPCLPPRAHQWFTGVGAGAGHTSVLELTNPDAGTALADITVLGGTGVVEAPGLRGVSVPAHSTVRLELARLVPRRGDLALDVLTVRGRIGASLRDQFDRVGSSPLTRDWLPGQIEPATTNLLMGLAPGPGRRTLVVANGGVDEARVNVRIVTPDSVFAPEGVPEIRVAPQTVTRVTLSSVLARAIAEDALGIEVTSSEPVTTTLRSQVRDDLSHAVPGVVGPSAATALLPAGAARGPRATQKVLELAGATRAGTVTVVSRSADGSELDRTKVDLTADRGLRVRLPAGTVVVTMSPVRTPVTGSVLVTGRAGAAVAPMVVPVTSSLVPDVRPGLP